MLSHRQTKPSHLLGREQQTHGLKTHIHYLGAYNPVREEPSPENQLALQPASLWKSAPKHLPHGL